MCTPKIRLSMISDQGEWHRFKKLFYEKRNVRKGELTREKQRLYEPTLMR